MSHGISCSVPAMGLACASVLATRMAVSLPVSALTDERYGLQVRGEAHAVERRALHLVCVAAHVGRAAPVDYVHARGAELRALASDVDRGVAAADDHDVLAGDLALVTELQLELHALDPGRRAEDTRALLAGDAEAVSAPRPAPRNTAS